MDTLVYESYTWQIFLIMASNSLQRRRVPHYETVVAGYLCFSLLLMYSLSNMHVLLYIYPLCVRLPSSLLFVLAGGGRG